MRTFESPKIWPVLQSNLWVHSSFSQLCVCIWDYYLAAWIDLLFNEDDFLLYSRQQNPPVDYSFVHLTKKASDRCQMSILQNSQKKMFSNKKSETAIICIWISLIKIGFSTEQTNFIFDKNLIELSFFAISWIECIFNYPIYDNLNMSARNCENFRQIAVIQYLWSGYE